MQKRIFTYILFTFGMFFTSWSQEDKWQGNAVDFFKGSLRVDTSGRYLEHKDGTPFLYIGDTAWELISRLNDEETELYMENRREKGITVIQTVILDELDGINSITACGSAQLINGDVDSPDSIYFARVDRVLELAALKGLYIALLPTWGDKVDKQWGMGPEIFNVENAYRYGKWLGQRYRDVPNLIWVIGGDRSGEDENFFIWNAFANGIKSIDQNHLMTYHPQGEHSSSFWFHNESWLDFNMIQTGHAQQNYDIYRRLLLPDLLKEPHKPCMDGEPRYENIPINFKVENGRFDDYDIRTTLYQSMLSGACGYTYGCNDIWQMYDKKHAPKCDADTPWQKSLDKPGAWDLIHFRRLWDRFDFRRGKPLSGIVRGDPALGENCPMVFGNSDYLLIYLPKGGEINIELPKKMLIPVSLKWMNPRTGEYLFCRNAENNLISVSAPSKGRGNDWVLIIEQL